MNILSTRAHNTQGTSNYQEQEIRGHGPNRSAILVIYDSSGEQKYTPSLNVHNASWASAGPLLVVFDSI